MNFNNNTLPFSQCSEPFIRGGMEWLSFNIHGQSFMMNQIRKMIGMY